MTTIEEAKKTMQEEIRKNTLNNEAIDALRETIEKMRHREINKSLETRFKKDHPEYNASYAIEHGLFTFTIWGNGIEYNDKVYLCRSIHHYQGDLTWDTLLDECKCHYFADYNEQLEKEMALLPEIKKAQKEIEKIRKRFTPVKLEKTGRCSSQFSSTIRKLFPDVLDVQY